MSATFSVGDCRAIGLLLALAYDRLEASEQFKHRGGIEQCPASAGEIDLPKASHAILARIRAARAGQLESKLVENPVRSKCAERIASGVAECVCDTDGLVVEHPTIRPPGGEFGKQEVAA